MSAPDKVKSLSIVDATETWLSSDACECAIKDVYTETIKGQGGNDRHIDFAVFLEVVSKLHEKLMADPMAGLDAHNPADDR